VKYSWEFGFTALFVKTGPYRTKMSVGCEDGFKRRRIARMERHYRHLNVRNGPSSKRVLNLMRILGETGFVSGNVKRILDVDKH
jgi:hypothetical protein